MREISSLEIRDEPQVGVARRAVHDFAERNGFGETALEQIKIVVQEIGTNAVRYATDGGWLHYSEPVGTNKGLELFYWDKGPGIYNLDQAINDGVSTSGSLGSGLGSIRRLFDEFEVYSTVRTTSRLTRRRSSHGTSLLARKWLGAPRRVTQGGSEVGRRIGVWSRPHQDETLNGDGYFMQTRDDRTLVAVIDGLGHGAGAKEATDVAIGVLEEWKGEGVDEVLMAVHDALRATRGAVMGAAIIDRADELIHFAGVGNISARAFETPIRFQPLSTNGTLGARLGRLRVWSERWVDGATFVMASDGISETWEIQSYPDLLKKSPQLLAGVLMRDYGRETDDATVLVVR